jgi:hypothetical protein
MRRCVLSRNLENEEALAHSGRSRQKKKKEKKNNDPYKKVGLSDFDPVHYVSTADLHSEHYSPRNFNKMSSLPRRKDGRASGLH